MSDDSAQKIVTLSLKLEAADKVRLASLALARDRTPHYLMREAVKEYLDREESREQFDRDTMAAWEDYQATGLHATQEQVMVWIESWRGPKKKPAPKCHR